MTTAKPIADSTLAMNIYNVIASYPDDLTADQIIIALRPFAIVAVPEQVQRVLAELVTLGRIKTADDTYALVASESLIVVARDLGDYNATDLTGGWEGWYVKDPRIKDGKGIRPIEALIGQAPTGRKIRPAPRKPKTKSKRRPRTEKEIARAKRSVELRAERKKANAQRAERRKAAAQKRKVHREEMVKARGERTKLKKPHLEGARAKHLKRKERLAKHDEITKAKDAAHTAAVEEVTS